MAIEERLQQLGSLIEAHEGLPAWFPHLVDYILDRLQNRDRFNLYQTSDFMRRTWHRNVVYAQEIRESIAPLEQFGVSYRGKQQHVLLPSKTLTSFWSTFYRPARSTPANDLSFFASMLLNRRHLDLTRDNCLRAHLPSSYKSITKERMVALLLRKLFDSPQHYKAYAKARRQGLSSAARSIYRSLSSTPMGVIDLLHPQNESGLITIELCDALLAKASYLERTGRLYLHLESFSGFDNPLMLPKAAPVEPPSLLHCLGPILDHVRTMPDDGGQPDLDDVPPRFPVGQLRLLRERCPEAEEIFDLVTWWRESLGSTPIEPGSLPGNYSLAQGLRGGNGTCHVLAIDGFDAKGFVGKALEFALLRKDSTGRLALTGFGDWVGGGPEPDLGVRETWGRNIDRVVLRLSPDWPEDFRTLLLTVATARDNTFVIARQDVLARRIPLERLLPILGGFVKLDTKRLARLRRWYSSAPKLKMLPATVVPMDENLDQETLRQTGRQVLEVDGYHVVIGLSPAQLAKSLQKIQDA